MSITTETYIYCDFKYPGCPGDPFKGGRLRALIAEDQRRKFSEYDWHRVGNSDCCPSCWEYRRKAIAGQAEAERIKRTGSDTSGKYRRTNGGQS